MNLNKDDLRRDAFIGVSGAIIVGAGSTVANAYTAARHAADAVNGWEHLGAEGWLNVCLNAGLAIGSEILGFMALGFVICFAMERAWPKFLAALSVGAIAIAINFGNSDEFVLRQDQAAAIAKVHAGAEYQAAAADADRTQRALAAGEGTGATAGAIAQEIEGLARDRDAARADGRWHDSRDLGAQISAARTRMAAAQSRAGQASGNRARLQAATATMATLEAGARPDAAAATRAKLLALAVEIVKALGLLAFAVDSPQTKPEKVTRPAKAPSSPVGGFEPVPVRVQRAQAPRAKAASASGLSVEARRERQRAYTAKWRAAKLAAA